MLTLFTTSKELWGDESVASDQELIPGKNSFFFVKQASLAGHNQLSWQNLEEFWKEKIQQKENGIKTLSKEQTLMVSLCLFNYRLRFIGFDEFEYYPLYK